MNTHYPQLIGEEDSGFALAAPKIVREEDALFARVPIVIGGDQPDRKWAAAGTAIKIFAMLRDIGSAAQPPEVVCVQESPHRKSGGVLQFDLESVRNRTDSWIDDQVRKACASTSLFLSCATVGAYEHLTDPIRDHLVVASCDGLHVGQIHISAYLAHLGESTLDPALRDRCKRLLEAVAEAGYESANMPTELRSTIVAPPAPGSFWNDTRTSAALRKLMPTQKEINEHSRPRIETAAHRIGGSLWNETPYVILNGPYQHFRIRVIIVVEADQSTTRVVRTLQQALWKREFKPRPGGLPMGPNQDSGGIGTHPSIRNVPEIHKAADGAGFNVRLMAGMGSDIRFLTDRYGEPLAFKKEQAVEIVGRVQEWNQHPVRSEERHVIEDELRTICGWPPVTLPPRGSTAAPSRQSSANSNKSK